MHQNFDTPSSKTCFIFIPEVQLILFKAGNFLKEVKLKR